MQAFRLVICLCLGLAWLTCGAEPQIATISGRQSVSKLRAKYEDNYKRGIEAIPTSQDNTSRIAVLITGQLFRFTIDSITTLAKHVVAPQLVGGACVDVYVQLSVGTATKVQTMENNRYTAQANETTLHTILSATLSSVSVAPSPPTSAANFGSLPDVSACQQGQARLVWWEIHADDSSDYILHKRFGLTFASSSKRSKQRYRNVKFYENLLQAHDALNTVSAHSKLFYDVIIRTRSDNVYFADHRVYVEPNLLGRVVPDGLLVPSCRGQKGINDKFAVMGVAAAAVYLRIFQIEALTIAHDAFHQYYEPERLFAQVVQRTGLRLHKLALQDYQGSHILWDSIKGEYCYRSFEGCVPANLLAQLNRSACAAATPWHKMDDSKHEAMNKDKRRQTTKAV